MGPRFRVSSERLEKSGIGPTTPGLEGEQLNHYATGASNRKVSYILLVMIRKRFSLLQTIIEDITFGLVRMYVTPYRFSWTIFILGLALSYKLCSCCS